MEVGLETSSFQPELSFDPMTEEQRFHYSFGSQADSLYNPTPWSSIVSVPCDNKCLLLLLPQERSLMGEGEESKFLAVFLHYLQLTTDTAPLLILSACLHLSPAYTTTPFYSCASPSLRAACSSAETASILHFPTSPPVQQIKGTSSPTCCL